MNTSLAKAIVTIEVFKAGFVFMLMISLFFLWGFSNNLRPILIPHLKRTFTLTTAQSSLVDTAVYIAYFIIAPAGYAVRRFEYKVGIVTDLILFPVGSFYLSMLQNTLIHGHESVS